MSRRRGVAILAIAALAAGFYQVASALTVLRSRSAWSLRPDCEAWAWSLRSPKVIALAELLEKVRARVPQRSVVVVVDNQFSDHQGFLIHWVQYLAPELDIALRSDVPAGAKARYLLELGIPSGPIEGGKTRLRTETGRLIRLR